MYFRDLLPALVDQSRHSVLRGSPGHGLVATGGHDISGGLLGHLVKDQQKQIEQVKLHDDWCRWLVGRLILQVPFHCTNCPVAHRVRI